MKDRSSALAQKRRGRQRETLLNVTFRCGRNDRCGRRNGHWPVRARCFWPRTRPKSIPKPVSSTGRSLQAAFANHCCAADAQSLVWASDCGVYLCIYMQEAVNGSHDARSRGQWMDARWQKGKGHPSGERKRGMQL